MNNSFFNILKKLCDGGVDFIIIGGFAGIVYGCTYVTQDIDICCDFSSKNLLRLQSCLKDINPVHRMTSNKNPLELTEDNCKDFKNLYLATDIGQLDCLSFVEGLGKFEDIIGKSRKIEIDNYIFNVLTIESLIKSKQALNRPHDRLAVNQLKNIQKLQQ